MMIIRFLRCFAQLCYVKLKALKMQFGVMMRHGFYLPEGAGIYHPKNVSIGKNFRLSRFCHLYCQDPENGTKLIVKDDVSLNHNVLLIADGGGQIYLGIKHV